MSVPAHQPLGLSPPVLSAKDGLSLWWDHSSTHATPDPWLWYASSLGFCVLLCEWDFLGSNGEHFPDVGEVTVPKKHKGSGDQINARRGHLHEGSGLCAPMSLLGGRRLVTALGPGGWGRRRDQTHSQRGSLPPEATRQAATAIPCLMREVGPLAGTLSNPLTVLVHAYFWQGS